MEPRFRDASRSLPFEAAARSHEALPDRDIGRDRHGSGRGSPDPGRAIEAPIVAPDGTALAPLDSAFARLIIHLATDENAGRGRFGQPTKFVMNIPGMTLEEREAVRLLGSEDAGRMIAIADKYAKSAIGAKARLGLPSGGIDYMGDVGAARGPGQYGGMPGGLGRYLGAGSEHGGIGLPGGHSYGGGPDAGGFGGSGGVSLSPYLLGGSHHGGVNVPGGHTVGGGPDTRGLGADGGLGQLPPIPGGRSRGSKDDGTYGYGAGRFGSGAQLPSSAWKALHPGGQVSEDPPAPPPKDENKGGDPNKNTGLFRPGAKQTPTERPDDRITAAAIAGGALGAAIGFEKGGPALAIEGFVFGVVGGVAYTYVSWRLRGYRPSDDDTSGGPGGPRARASNQVRGDGAFMPAPDDAGPVGPRATNRGPDSTFRPADDGSGPAGPVGPRSSTAEAYRDRGGLFMPNPDDPNGPSGPRARSAST